MTYLGSGCASPGTLGPPTLTGFQAFIVNTMGISNITLPPSSPVISMAFTVASDIVNCQLACASPDIYTLAVYNLAGSNVINYATDQPGAPVYQDGMTFFNYLRKIWNVYGFVSGVVQAANDQGTGDTLVVQDFAKDFTLYDLQRLKDPYGRAYLELAQKYGSLWGIT